jgi:hypothetical protein
LKTCLVEKNKAYYIAPSAKNLQMKIFHTLLFLLFAFFLNAQKQQNNYNTKIDRAEKVEVNNGIISIKNADTVILKITIIEKKTFLYLDSLIQTYDSTKKKFVTKFYFSNHQSPKTEFELLFKFNIEVNSFQLRPNGSGSSQIQGGSSKDKKQLYYTGTIVSGRGFFVETESLEKLKSEIRGIDGAFKN